MIGLLVEGLRHSLEVLDLNTRETAILIWLAVGLLGLFFIKNIAQSAGQLIKAFFAPILIRAYLGLITYVTLIVFILARLGLWGLDNLKTTLVWGITFAFVTMFRATKLVEERGSVRRLLRETFSGAAVVLFISQIATLPLWGELILFPLLLFVGLLLAVAEGRPENAIVVPPLQFVAGTAGLGILGWSAFQVATHFHHYATAHTVREFGLPIALSALFLPYAYGVGLLAEYQSAFIRLEFLGRSKAFVGHARRRAFWAFGGNLDLTRRLVRDIQLQEVTDSMATLALIRREQTLAARERTPPAVPLQLGWSPYAAIAVLEDTGVPMGDYHQTNGSWGAESTTAKVWNELGSYRLSGSVRGGEVAATQLAIDLDIDYPAPKGAEALFEAAVSKLVRLIVPGSEPLPSLPRTTRRKGFLLPNGVVAHLTRNSWGDAKYGGYCRRLVLRHPAAPANEP